MLLSSFKQKLEKKKKKNHNQLNVAHTSRKHTYIILTYLNPTFIE